MSTSLRQRIVEAKKTATLSGTSPTRLHLPVMIENEILDLGRGELGDDLFSDISVLGARDAVQKRGNRLLGLDVIWNAAEFRVE